MRDDEALPDMKTSIGYSTTEEIWVRGYNLSHELMGEIDFGSMLFLLVSGRLPSPEEARLFNAILVALADHGLTPTALAARLTYTGAPDAIQGAIASGILGAGSVFLGVFGEVGHMLEQPEPTAETTEEQSRDTAKEIVAVYNQDRQRIPGLGHPVHKNVDPRTARLLSIADELGLLGPRTRLMLQIREEASNAIGRNLVLNATGASAALLADMGFDAAIMRGFAVVSRAAGIVGHLQEEREQPIGHTIWRLVERESTYGSTKPNQPSQELNPGEQSWQLRSNG